MPILILDYSWKESDTTVIITVPLKGVKANKVDVFSTDQYLKVRHALIDSSVWSWPTYEIIKIF